MTTVPSTPTSSSRNLEAKMLADGNALLIQKRDVLEREVRDFTAARDAMVLSIKGAPAQAEAERRLFEGQVRALETRIKTAKNELWVTEEAIERGKIALRAQEGVAKTLGAAIEVLKASVATWEGKKEVAETSARESETKYAKIIKEKGDEIADLTTKAARIKSAGETEEENNKKRLAAVVEQERVTTVRRDDLAIKEARLRKLYPNNPIII